MDNKIETLLYIIEQGADYKTPDKYGLTPLQRAAQTGQWDVVKYFEK